MTHVKCNHQSTNNRRSRGQESNGSGVMERARVRKKHAACITFILDYPAAVALEWVQLASWAWMQTTSQHLARGENYDQSGANTSSHFCELVRCLYDVFKCVIVVFCIGNNTFLNEQRFLLLWDTLQGIKSLHLKPWTCFAACFVWWL